MTETAAPFEEEGIPPRFQVTSAFVVDKAFVPGRHRQRMAEIVELLLRISVTADKLPNP